MKFSTEDFCGFQESADLVTFTEEIHNGNSVFMCEFLFENFIFLEPSPLSLFSHSPIEVMLRANTNVCFCI